MEGELKGREWSDLSGELRFGTCDTFSGGVRNRSRRWGKQVKMKKKTAVAYV